MSEKFDYMTVFHLMTQDEVDAANIALDMQIAADKKALNQ